MGCENEYIQLNNLWRFKRGSGLFAFIVRVQSVMTKKITLVRIEDLIVILIGYLPNVKGRSGFFYYYLSAYSPLKYIVHHFTDYRTLDNRILSTYIRHSPICFHTNPRNFALELSLYFRVQRNFQI